MSVSNCGDAQREIEKAQAGCICVHESARQCMRLRYPRWQDDDDWGDDEACGCCCHDEIREIEEAYGLTDY